MSEFDKEAEREKLREKYGDEQKDREATARMSDLLLKGATMTDTHCGTCGDPIFRHEGQEFCPTCQQEVQTEDTTGSDQEQTPEQAPDATTTDPAGESPANGTATRTTTDTATDTPTGDPPTQGDPPARGDPPTQSPAQQGQPRLPAGESVPSSQADTSGGSLATARTSLTTTITRLAQQAEASEDLERARAYLAATEEAADALAAVKQADR